MAGCNDVTRAFGVDPVIIAVISPDAGFGGHMIDRIHTFEGIFNGKRI